MDICRRSAVSVKERGIVRVGIVPTHTTTGERTVGTLTLTSHRWETERV